MIGTSRDTFETWWSEYADIDSDKDSAKDAWQASRKALEAEITLLRALIQKAQSESELIEYKGKAAIVVPYSFMKAATEMPEQAQHVSDENSVEYWKSYAEAGVESFNLMMIELTALRAQQAQAVEPTSTKTEQIAGAISKHISTPLFQREVMAAAQYIVHRYLHPAMHLSEILAEKGIKLRTEFEPKPDHIVDSNKMVGERASLIRRADASVTALNSRIMEPFYCSLDQDAARVLSDCVDMLEADAKEIEATERQVEILSDDISKCSKQAQQVAVPQAIEDLAGVTVCCGDFAKCHRPCTPRGQWMATEAQQVAVPAQEPLSDEQIESLREKTFSTGNPYCPVDSKSMRKAAHAIEQAHGITPQGDKQ